MLADTYTLNGVVFTKRSSDEIRGAKYTSGSDPLALQTLLIKYQEDRKGVIRTLVDLSTNVPDVTNTKVDHVRRRYWNTVRYPSDAETDLQVDAEIMLALEQHSTLPGLINDRTV